MDTQETYIDRMNAEHAELTERFQKLSAFMASDKFLELDGTDKALLQTQFTGMSVYLNALGMRLFKEDLKAFEAFAKNINAEIARLKEAGRSDEEIVKEMKPIMDQVSDLNLAKYGVNPLSMFALLPASCRTCTDNIK